MPDIALFLCPQKICEKEAIRCKKGTAKCEKAEVVTQKSVNVYVFFLPQTYLDSHIFYLILQQENQDLANAMHQGCPTRSLREPRGTAMIKQLLRTGFLLKNISKTLEN